MANITGTVQDRDTDLNELAQRAESMHIKPFVPNSKPGVYDDQVDTLIQVDEQSGVQNSIEVLVPTADIKKHKRYFSASAAKRDKTARIVNGEEGVSQGDGGTILEFVLTQKVHRKPKTDLPVTDTTDDAA